MDTLRMTLQTQLVLRALLADPTQPRYGPSGTLYPILTRLEQAGWVESAWEDLATHETAGRPRRRSYRVRPDGAEHARDALARAYHSGRQPRLGWGTLPNADGARA
jgi:PadR family transcriptional regulator, regulatory protein PadR